MMNRSINNSLYLLFHVGCLVLTHGLRFKNAMMGKACRIMATTADPSSIPPAGNSNWQVEVDKFLDIDTPCETRRDISLNILKKSGEIFSDVTGAIREGNIEAIAPQNLNYGKAFKGLQAFQNQLISDLIPDLLSGKVLQSMGSAKTSEKVREVLQSAPGQISKLVETVQEISQDPSLLQSTVDSIRREARNIVKSTPEGLETPSYSVIKASPVYEIRKYAQYSVCKLNRPDNREDSLVGENFNSLAGYIFGDNLSNEKMDMTTPVIMEDGIMSFVLAGGKNSETAPTPVNRNISLVDIPVELLAVKEFPGIATDGEVERQVHITKRTT